MAPVPAHALEQAITLSVYQGPCHEGDFAANLATARQVVAQAQERGSHFVLFPECFLSGYESREPVAQGARPLDDPELQRFITDTAQHNLVVIVGLARKAADGLYNTMLVLQRGRLLGRYDKILLTPDDRDALGFKPGTALPIFTAHGARFAVVVCADTSYPHAALAARLQGAEILFTPHNNEIGEAAAQDHLRWVRNCHIGIACQFRLAVARANIIKTDRPHLVGYGDSFILSPQGTPLAEAGLFKTGLFTATLTPAHFQPPWVWGELEDVPAWLRLQLGELITNFRKPTDDADLRQWLENMVIYHRFTPAEVSQATGLTLAEVAAATERFNFASSPPAPRQSTDPLRVLPYPGGRHPRIGFLDGAVAPQRDTKVSVFTPWNDQHYVVADIPEAIWSNLGLTYLAHQHIDTVWSRAGIRLPPLEWQRQPEGTLTFERTLPNGIAFGTVVRPAPDGLRLETWLRNGTPATLTGLRMQHCIMLKDVPEFADLTATNKVFHPPYAACRSPNGRRWVITAWDPLDAVWHNPDVPCVHSNPKFPDCPPGQTVRARGWLSFFEGEDLPAECARIERLGWRQGLR